MSSALDSLIRQLPLCLSRDRQAFKRQLDGLRRAGPGGPDFDARLKALAVRIARSSEARSRRAGSIPVLNFPDLPVTAKKDDIADLIRKHQTVIVCGETGSGKTTQLPKICLSIGRGAAGFIGHTQPRRIAARTVADRLASELGQSVGQAVGYKIRFNDKTHAESLVKLMTDGILLAETQADPYLSQYDTIIVDEAHERSLNIDFLIGYLKWLLPKRPDLKLIITSATIDQQRFSDHFDRAPIIEVSGRTYPVDIRYRPIDADAGDDEEDETGDRLQNAILAAVDELYRDLRGDILVFLSGEREIRETAESLKKHHAGRYEILPLYAKLSVGEQEKVFNPKGGKIRIVLATNVAETSLTVPGIRCVIDTGHARISRYSHRSKIQRLPIERISRSGANQRAGRCGRVAEGICIRLYSHEDYLARPEFTEPEIMRTNLSAVILQMAALKLGAIEEFPFLEPPDEKMIRDGKTMLQEISALDKSGQLTEIGLRLARLPVDPKLARMLLAADQNGCLTEAAVIVSALSIQDPREKPADKLAQAEAKQAVFRHEESDFLSLLNLWRAFEEQKRHLSNSKLRQYCRDHFLSYVRMREWFDIHSQIMQTVCGELKLKANAEPAGYEAIHKALLPGLLSNVGFRHEQYEYLGARGLKFFIFPGSGQHKTRPKWIMAAEQVETSKVYARTVARIEPEWIEECAGHLVKRNYYDPHWEKKAARGAIHERTLLYGLTLQAGRKIPYERVDPAAARRLFIQSALVDQDYHTSAPFFRANRQLLEEVGIIQHKGRRVDLVEDEEWLYHFYDAKLPADVVSGIALDTWRKTAEKADPEVLFLTREDLTREQDHVVNDRDYPDSKKIGHWSVPLVYRFEPGHDEDGVTAVIPVHQLNQMAPAPFEWLVPGMLEEKCIAMIKALPKQIRRHFVPVPETVKKCLEIEPDFKGAIQEWLGTRLRKLTGEAVPLTAWDLNALPPHLKMNFHIVDERRQLLDSGRDLKRLQQKYSREAGQSFDQIAAGELHHTGYIAWGFDDLPETYEFGQRGQRFLGFPALVDEGAAVGVRIFDTAAKAELQHRAGLARLFRLSLRKECAYLAKNMPLTPDAELAYQRLPEHRLIKTLAPAALRDDMLFLILAQVFVDGRIIRTQAAFEQSLNAHRSGLIPCADEAGRIMLEIMTLHQAVRGFLSRLNAGDLLRQDAAAQLDLLIYRGFARTTPYAQFKALPRYLKAVHYRLERRGDDRQKVQEISRYATRYWQDVERKLKKTVFLPEQEHFRWALEEFRVSLFAQQLKTAYPISAKRLDKIWEERAAG